MDCRCEECTHFCRADMGDEGRCDVDGRTTWRGCPACAKIRRIMRCVVCGEILPKGKRRFCGDDCYKKSLKTEFSGTKPRKKGRKKSASSGLGIEEITRIAVVIADETGHMPSYGKVVADIDTGRIKNPEEYLRRVRRRYDG